MESKDEFDEIMSFKHDLKTLDTSFLYYDTPQWNEHRYELFAKYVGIELNKRISCKFNFSIEKKFGIPYLKLLVIHNGVSKECEMELSILYYKNVPTDLHITVASRFVELFNISKNKETNVADTVINKDIKKQEELVESKISTKKNNKK